MDIFLQRAISAAKINGKKDPDSKAKEMFVRLFKNDDFLKKFIHWRNADIPYIRQNTFLNEKVFLSFWEMGGDLSLPDKLRNYETARFDSISPAIFSFALFGKVVKWPVFGCKLVAKTIFDDYCEATIEIDPEASKEDVERFIQINWSKIKEIGEPNFTATKIGKIKPIFNHALNAAILDLYKDNKSLNGEGIYKELKNLGYKEVLKDKQYLSYIRQVISREKKLHKSLFPKNKNEKHDF